MLTEVKHLVQLDEGLGEGVLKGMTHSRVLNGEEVADIMRLGKGIHVKTLREKLDHFERTALKVLFWGILGVSHRGFTVMVPGAT